MAAQFEQLGFVPTHRHPRRNITRCKQGRINLMPQPIEGTMAFMFETRHVVRLSQWAASAPTMQRDSDDLWSGFTKAELSR